ncbi:MAG TPA: outer membrane beta-barrel protein [Puia sp.]|nr:outer membrane beta-barrel protein [Puia sp.]
MKKSLHSFTQKCALILSLLLAVHLSSFSQLSAGNYLEAGFTIAPMGFLGDLGGHTGKGTTFLKDYNMNTTKLSYGVFVAAHPAEWLGIRGALNYGGVEGDDAKTATKGGEEVSRKNRNLNFRSNIYEGYLALELYPTVFLENDPTDVQGRLRPYGLLGVGVFHFNPQGTYTDPSGYTSWVDLRPLHTEGEGFPEYPTRKEYSLTQINIPMGVGVKYYFTENLNVSFEIVHRKTFTDYIDDVSTNFVDPSVFYAHLSPAMAQIADQMSNKSPLRGTPGSGYNPGDKRGDPNQKDAYFTMGFKIGIRIGSARESEWRNSTRCPVLRF